LVGQIGADDKVTERKLFSFIKIPEAFKVGDIVRLKHPEKYKRSDDIYGYQLNLYKIKSLGRNEVKLDNVSEAVPTSELLPVAIDRVEDRWIYYEPIVAAHFLFDDENYEGRSTDYTYYLDAFENTTENGKTYKEIVTKRHLMYVHEIQHWLRKKEKGRDSLKVNIWKH
jgi:hypothetical protein